MFDRNRSGQFLYFDVVSAISGNAVAGIASGNISGRVAIDGGAQAVIAGPIIEDGGGQYHVNLFAADVNGNCLGFLFTMSGCVPRNFTVITQQNVSGKLFPASGAHAVVPPASLSGVVANSGLFVTVPIASISGAVGNSGQFVSVLKENLSGVVANSGLFVSVLPANLSGVVFASGGHVTVLKENLSGVVANSGLFTNAALLSGQSVLVYSGQLSGFQLTARSVLDKSGYLLGGAGLDSVWVESGSQAGNASGVNVRQGLALNTAALAGQCSGNRTGTMTYDGAAVAGTTRLTATIDSSGNRSEVVVTLP